MYNAITLAILSWAGAHHLQPQYVLESYSKSWLLRNAMYWAQTSWYWHYVKQIDYLFLSCPSFQVQKTYLIQKWWIKLVTAFIHFNTNGFHSGYIKRGAIRFLQQFNIRRLIIIKYHTQCSFVDFFHFVSTFVRAKMPDCTTVQKLESTKVLYNLILTSSLKKFETLLRACVWFDAREQMDDICFSKCNLSSMCRPSIFTRR